MKFVALKDEHWPWIKEQIKLTRCEDSKGIVAVSDEDDVVGAVVLDNRTHNFAVAHIAVADSKVWKAGLLSEVYTYAFDTCGLKFLLGSVFSTKPEVLAFLKSLGWREAYRIKDGYADGVDIVYPQYTKDQWMLRRAA